MGRRARHPDHAGPGAARGVREDIIRYYAKCLAAARPPAHARSPDHPGRASYVADSKAQAVREAGPYTLYFNQTLFSHGNISERGSQREAGYLSVRLVRLHRGRRTCRPSPVQRERFRGMTMADVERDAEQMPWGTADEVRRADHRRRRPRRRQHRAAEHESGRDAAGDVHGADPAFRRRGAAGAAGPPGHTDAGVAPCACSPRCRRTTSTTSRPPRGRPRPRATTAW